MMFWYGHDLSVWGWVGMILTMLAFWALVVAAVVWLIGATRTGDRRPPGPEELLAERFARGDINDTEYRDRLAALRGTPARQGVRR